MNAKTKKPYALTRHVDGKYFSTAYFDTYEDAYREAERIGEANCIIDELDEDGCVVARDVFKNMPTPY